MVHQTHAAAHPDSLRHSSNPPRRAPTPRQTDADGRLLWRFTPRRLEAEAIRDSMLAVSGALDLKMGGPGFYLMDVVEENVMHYFPKEKFTPAEFRRMVYLFRIRADAGRRVRFVRLPGWRLGDGQAQPLQHAAPGAQSVQQHLRAPAGDILAERLQQRGRRLRPRRRPRWPSAFSTPARPMPSSRASPPR